MTPLKHSMLGRLHPTQEKLIDVLKELDSDSLPLRDIAEKIGVKSPNTVAHHIEQLEKKGYIFRDTITKKINLLKNPVKDIVFLNVYGLAECGVGGYFVEENILDRVPLPAKTFRVTQTSFLVEAVGDSMSPVIESGDLVLADKTSVAEDGDLVVVIHNGTAKIKKFFKKAKAVILQSVNPAYPPLSAFIDDDLEIAGVVTGIVRKFQS
jgi:repressor LexA